MAGSPPPRPRAMRPAPPKVFDCPQCGSGVIVRAVGVTVSVACKSCGSVIDATNENHQILSKAAQAAKVEPVIPLGQRGRLHGVVWEVIGFMQRSDSTGMYRWGEYLLFNPARGFRWLTEFDGHWNYVVTTHDKPVDHDASVHLLGKDYKRFHVGSAVVRYVVGEFYWRVKAGDSVMVADYISPPEILSKEYDAKEVIWSLGEYIEPEKVRQAFQIAGAMPPRNGIAPNQPSSVKGVSSKITAYWGILIATLFAIQIVSLSRSINKRVLFWPGLWKFPGASAVQVTHPFELDNGVSNLAFALSVPKLQNNWLELDIELVNDDTGKTRSFEQGVEFYSGYDGGYWSEGSRSSKVFLSSVPDGKYHLNLQAVGGSPGSWAGNAASELEYSLAVVRDAADYSNFGIALLLVTVFPLLIWMRHHSFERSRWSTSDFSPYWSLEEDE